MKLLNAIAAAALISTSCVTAQASEARPGKERIEFWAIPGGDSCQRILDKVTEYYGTRIRTLGGVYQERDSPWKINNTVAVLMDNYEQSQSIGPQIARNILNGCAMSPAGVTEVVFHHRFGSGNWATWRWGKKPDGNGYIFEPKCTIFPNPNSHHGPTPPKDWSETYCN